MLWINFLHFYQPANKEAFQIREATDKSFLRVLRALEEHPRHKFTLNINACMFLRWEEIGYGWIFPRLQKLLASGRLEICGNAAYHPLLPLVPLKEARMQISESEAIFKKFLGQDFRAKGFFLSEMAYSATVAKLVKSLGYEWLILDEIACPPKLVQHPSGKCFIDRYSGLEIILRDRRISNCYAPDVILKLLEEKSGQTLITASDGELYGLRHEDPTGEFERLLKNQNLKTMLVSDYIREQKTCEKIRIRPSNWESSEAELVEGRPYAVWQGKKSGIQKKLWDLAHYSWRTCEKYKKDKNYAWARWHLVRGLASCTFWWASEKDFKHNFGPFAWNPDEVERGLDELVRAVRSIDSRKSRAEKITAEKAYLDLKKRIWEKHWKKYW